MCVVGIVDFQRNTERFRAKRKIKKEGEERISNTYKDGEAIW
jgi:hypothetical protein